MSTMATITPTRRRANSVRRTTRFVLACESLESRQLLSVGNSGLVAPGILPLSAAQSQFAAPPIFSNFGNSGFSSGQFGSLNAQNESPIIVIVVGVLPVSFNGGSNFATTSSTGLSGTVSAIGALTGNTGNSNSGNALATSSVSTSVPSITPLNPNLTSSVNTPGGPPVQLIPPPLPPLVVHLTASTAPATNQSNSTLLSIADEQPATITHFGQGAESEIRRVTAERIERETMNNSLIDFVEPYRAAESAPVQAVDPAQPGVGEKALAPAPDPANARPLPPLNDPNIDALLNMTDARILTRSRDDAAARSEDRVDQGNAHWSLSALFGVAAVATGGYHLVLRESDRFRGRSIPRWVGAERPTKRKTGVPSR